MLIGSISCRWCLECSSITGAINGAITGAINGAIICTIIDNSCSINKN